MINTKEQLQKVISFCIFCAVLFSITSCNSSRNTISSKKKDHEWKIVKVDKKDEPTWIIYTRKVTETNFLEYKIEGDVKSSPQACISSFKQDIHHQAEDVENKKFPTYEISDQSEKSLLTYVIHNEPFPLKDTEMSVRYLFFSEEDGSMGVRWHEAWDECSIQPSRKLSRVQTFRGSWDFSPIYQDACKAVNSVQFDLKKMPLWLVEPMVLKFLKDGLEDMRGITAG